MVRAELHADQCFGCGASLDWATFVERADVTYTTGEFCGEPGVALVALCYCGMTSVIPFSVSPRRAT